MRSSSARLELRALQRVLHAQQQVALAHAVSPAVGQRDDPPARFRRELGAPPGLDRARARVGDRLLDAAPFGGHGANGHPAGCEHRDAQDDAEGDEHGEHGEADPEAARAHDRQAHSIFPFFRGRIDQSSSGGVAMVVTTTMKTAAA